MSTATRGPAQAATAPATEEKSDVLGVVITETVRRAVSEKNFERAAKLPGVQGAVLLAEGIQELTDWLNEEANLGLLKWLAGRSLGFKTDRDTGNKGKYDVDVLVDCAAEALLRGANLTGNEFNIISGKVYLTKEFFERRLREFPGLTDLKLEYDLPTMRRSLTGADAAQIACKASWVLNGQEDRIDATIPIRLFGTDTDDLLLGKAARKLMARVFSRLTGTTIPEGGSDDAPTRPEPEQHFRKPQSIGQDDSPDTAERPLNSVSEPQRKRMFALAKKHGIAHPALKTYLKTKFEIESTNDLTLDAYNDVCEWIQSHPVSE